MVQIRKKTPISWPKYLFDLFVFVLLELSASRAPAEGPWSRFGHLWRSTTRFVLICWRHCTTSKFALFFGFHYCPFGNVHGSIVVSFSITLASFLHDLLFRDAEPSFVESTPTMNVVFRKSVFWKMLRCCIICSIIVVWSSAHSWLIFFYICSCIDVRIDLGIVCDWSGTEKASRYLAYELREL